MPQSKRHGMLGNLNIKPLNRIDEQSQGQHQVVFAANRTVPDLFDRETRVLQNADHVVNGYYLPGWLSLLREDVILTKFPKPEKRQPITNRHQVVVAHQEHTANIQVVLALFKKLQGVVELHHATDRKYQVKLCRRENMKAATCIHQRKVRGRYGLRSLNIAAQNPSAGEKLTQRRYQVSLTTGYVEYVFSMPGQARIYQVPDDGFQHTTSRVAARNFSE